MLDRAQYQPVDQEVWAGRADARSARLWQVIRCVDLSDSLPPACLEFHYVLLGFACDEGVRRNQGRPGAAEGPMVIRQYLANLPVPAELNVIDGGNIYCHRGDLESAQQQLAQVVAICLDAGYQPIVLGGGHEIAWGHYQGIAHAFPDKTIGSINFDAHFDCRPLDEDKKGHSGSSFYQIAQALRDQSQSLHYLCLGVQPTANTVALFAQAKKLGCQYFIAGDVVDHRKRVKQAIEQFIASVDCIYLTLCLDVFQQSIAPGVSAPQPLGLLPHQLLPLWRYLAESHRVVSLDIAEYAPCYDSGAATARLAAALVGEYLFAGCHYVPSR